MGCAGWLSGGERRVCMCVLLLSMSLTIPSACWSELLWEVTCYFPPLCLLRASPCGALGWQLSLAHCICLLTGGWDLHSRESKHGLLHRQKRKMFVCLTCIAVVPGSLLFQLMLWCVFSERLWHCEWGTVADLNFGGKNRGFHQVPEEIDDRLANDVLSWEPHSSCFPELLAWFPVVFPPPLQMINSAKEGGNHFCVVGSAQIHWYLCKEWMLHPFFCLPTPLT